MVKDILHSDGEEEFVQVNNSLNNPFTSQSPDSFGDSTFARLVIRMELNIRTILMHTPKISIQSPYHLNALSNLAALNS